MDNACSNFSERKALFPMKSILGVLVSPLDVSALLPVESRATALVVRNKDNDRNRREAQKVAAREDGGPGGQALCIAISSGEWCAYCSITTRVTPFRKGSKRRTRKPARKVFAKAIIGALTMMRLSSEFDSRKRGPICCMSWIVTTSGHRSAWMLRAAKSSVASSDRILSARPRWFAVTTASRKATL